MKYYRMTQILKEIGSDRIVEEVIGYCSAESLESLQEHEEELRDVMPIYKWYDVQNIYEECSKEEYDDYCDRHISREDLINKNVQ